MAVNPPSASLQRDLTEHARWLQQLARHLVREREAAADLAQDTVLAALRHAPARIADLKPWLARVMRNRSLDLHRRRERRLARENDVAREEATPDSSGVVERLEVEQQLLAAVRELAEPYRTAVTQRYLEGLEPVEIARREGLPAGTVRWRVSEGLARLRRALDEKSDRRESWQRALLPLAGLPAAELELGAAVGAPALLFGGLIVKLSLIVALVALTALIALRWSGERPADPEVLEPVAKLDVDEPTDAADDATEPVRTAPPEPRREPVEAGTVAPAGLEASPAPYPVRARVVDELGNPLSGIDVEPGGALPSRASGVTDAHGEYEFLWADELHEASVVLSFSAPGRVTRELHGSSTGDDLDLGTVILEPGGAITGRVIDEKGAPCAEVEVSAGDGAIFLLAESYSTARTDDAGRFHLEGLPLGHLGLRAHRIGDRRERDVEMGVQLERGIPLEGIEIVLPRPEGSGATTGRVLRPDGTPAPFARLTGRAENETSSGTFGIDVDEEGHFTIEGWQYDEYELEAVDRDEPALCVSGIVVERGLEGIELRLERARVIELVIHGGDGERISEYEVSLLEAIEGEERPRRGRLRTWGADGKRVFADPPRPFELQVSADGFRRATSPRYAPSAAPEPLEIELEPLPRITGRALRDGRPIEDAEVVLVRELRLSTRVWVDDLPRDWDELRDSPPATTGADGAFSIPFELPLPPAAPSLLDRLRGRAPDGPRPYGLRVSAPERGYAFVAPIDLDEGAPPELVIELVPGGAIHGRLLLDPELSPAGRWIAVGDGRGTARAMELDESGEYAFDDLPVGSWLVRNCGEGDPVGGRSVTGGLSEARHIEWDCTVIASEATRFDVDERGAPRLEGRLRIDGASPGPWSVMALRGREGSDLLEQFAGMAKVEGEGVFHLELTRTGPHLLSLWGALGEVERVELLVPIEIHPGLNAFALDLLAAPLAGSWTGERAAESVQLRATLEGGGLWMVPIEAGVREAVLAAAPPGPVRFVRAEPTDPLGEPVEVLLELELPASGLEDVAIPD